MIKQDIEVNNKTFHLTLTDEHMMYAKKLKSLYDSAYEDPESFEEVSSEISQTVNNLASAVDPPVSDSDLDGVIQEIMRVIDEKTAESEEAKQKAQDAHNGETAKQPSRTKSKTASTAKSSGKSRTKGKKTSEAKQNTKTGKKKK